MSQTWQCTAALVPHDRAQPPLNAIAKRNARNRIDAIRLAKDAGWLPRPHRATNDVTSTDRHGNGRSQGDALPRTRRKSKR